MTTSAPAAVAAPSRPRPALPATPPTVSVVTAARDVRGFIGPTAASVLGQTLRAVEFILVDDASSDGTADAASAGGDPRVRVLRTGSPSGVGRARNLGLSQCRAPYVVFLDGDDLLEPDALERMVAALESAPDRVACFGHHIRIAEDGSPFEAAPPALKRLPDRDTLWHLLAKNFIVNGGAICIRTGAAHAVGGYRTDLALGEDWEFWCRLAARGDFAVVPGGPVLRYRQREAGANRRLRGSALRPNYDALDRIFAAPDLPRRFPPAALRDRRRRAEMDSFWSAARGEYLNGRALRFAQYLLVGALRYPDSLFRVRLVALFVASLFRTPRRA
ncbi:MAG TPA: glycosyltransferase family A protein [Azospirillum sp.]|nr:glycosyltransferase family A protein [Azospirillum sp.]